MQFNPYQYRYPSQRNLVYSNRGVVATSSPYASSIGLDILKRGGNAVDAAVAVAAALTVAEPSANGIGGDLFAQVYMNRQLYGLNASGRAPALMTHSSLAEKGKIISTVGFDGVSVPGIPSGWAALNERFGTLSLETLMEPAAQLAEQGFAVPIQVSLALERYHGLFQAKKDAYPVLGNWFTTFSPNGVLMPGEVLILKDHAKALRAIGKTGAKSFYEGEIAEAIDRFSKEFGGFLRYEDLKNHQVEWVTPISLDYRGYKVYELPPNGIGLIALMGLNTLEALPVDPSDKLGLLHQQMESMKLAFTDGLAVIGDPAFTSLDLRSYLSKEYGRKRSSLISDQALMPQPSEPLGGSTVYFCVGDQWGNMVSLIQSCFTGFGSGCVVPEWGISLHNRASQFSLDENHPNCVHPGKRPFHTIIPGFLGQGVRMIGPFGVMGGPLQPQAHLQVISSLIDQQCNPQEALDAPRWQWVSGRHIQVELRMDPALIAGLRAKGHAIEVLPDKTTLGRGQIIFRQGNGVYVGATEGRTDSSIAIW